MSRELHIQQIRLESRALDHVAQALTSALDWKVVGDGFVRKLSSVRFFADLYQRHVERLFALGEIGGFMEDVSRLHPELANQVDQLRANHEKFRAAIRESIVRISLASPDKVTEFETICEKLRATVREVIDSLRCESELLVDSLNQDTGGEG
jgi:hypothetical protein